MTKPLLTGVLKTWKEDRGFGFIAPHNGSRDVFIHISAIGDTARRPVPGDIIQYQLVRDKNGKYRAINASIEGVAAKNIPTISGNNARPTFLWLKVTLAVLAAILGAAVLFYYRTKG
jgi:CspA family cold shock protein